MTAKIDFKLFILSFIFIVLIPLFGFSQKNSGNSNVLEFCPEHRSAPEYILNNSFSLGVKYLVQKKFYSLGGSLNYAKSIKGFQYREYSLGFLIRFVGKLNDKVMLFPETSLSFSNIKTVNTENALKNSILLNIKYLITDKISIGGYICGTYYFSNNYPGSLLNVGLILSRNW